MSDKVAQVKDIIKAMTMVEVLDLVKVLEEEFGVVAMAQQMGSAPSGASTEEVKEEQKEFDVIIKSCGASKIPVIKEIRAITGLGLKESKALAESNGKAIKEKVSKEDAEEVKSKLEKIGAVIEIV